MVYIILKHRWTSKSKKTSFKTGNMVLCLQRKIGWCRCFFNRFVGKFACWDKSAQCKFTNCTLIKWVVLMRNFGVLGIGMMAFFFLKKLMQVFKGMQRLNQHCKQYRQH
ncbi:MAG: hypothetical protein RLZ77_1356 [Bacteroidota bacterium]